MTPESAVLLSAALTTGGGLATFVVSRWDKASGRRDQRDAKVLEVEQQAFQRATASDIALITRLEERVTRAEARADAAERRSIQLARRVFQLERTMAEAGMELPPS